MNNWFKSLLLVFAFGLAATAQSTDQAPRTLVHLLDYISQDYAGAVAGGQIISKEEFGEMQEFCASAETLGAEIPELREDAEVRKQLQQLRALVESKAGSEKVAQAARAAKQRVLQLTKLTTSPATLPSLANGRALFQQNCAACHGFEGRGDGPGAAALNPKPTNFHDAARMSLVSPFAAFNTIRLGVAKTAMVPLPNLSNKDAWDLAFFTIALRHQSAPAVPGAVSTISLETAATKSDAELTGLLSGTDEQKRAALAAIRLRAGSVEQSAELALGLLSRALGEYDSGNFDAARSSALSAYLDGIEPIEPRLRAVSPRLVTEVEQAMTAVRGGIEKQIPRAELASRIQAAVAAIKEARAKLAEEPASPWFVFSISAAVILREGFEAVLIIIAILGVVRAARARRAALWVHGGWISALLLGLLTWFFSAELLRLSGLNREMMEGITSLVAIAILLYLGFWLHSRTEIGRWKQFIEGQVRAALEGGNVFGLASLSFLAVFREAFETVIFLAALSLEGGPKTETAMAAGVVTSLAFVIIASALIVRFSARIPIRHVFTASSALMIVLAVVMTGKGVHAFQEAGVVPVSTLPKQLSLDWIGLFPSIETVGSQCAVALVAAVLWWLASRPSAPRLEPTPQ